MFGKHSVKNMGLMYNISYTQSAVDDLDTIFTYLIGYANASVLVNFKIQISNCFEQIIGSINCHKI